MNRLTPSDRATLAIAMRPPDRPLAMRPFSTVQPRFGYAFSYGYLLGYAKDAVRLLQAGRHVDAERVLREGMERVREFEPKGTE